MVAPPSPSLAEYRTLFDLTGRSALVVGAGRGIGEACAEGLAAFGALVHCADLDLAAAKETAESIVSQGGEADAAPLDILDARQVRDALDDVGTVDVMVSTPSANIRKRVVDTSDEEVERVLDLNLKATYRLLREVGRSMAACGGGSIIAFSSIRAVTVEPGQAAYAATKAGTVQILRALAVELSDQGVRANAIAPGVVETPLTAQIKDHPEWYDAYASKSVLGRWSRPDELVGATVFLASDASSYVTGSVLFVDGGWTAVDGRYSPPL